MEFLHRYLGCNTVYLSKPTWGNQRSTLMIDIAYLVLLANHRGICEDAGLQDIREYSYYKQETRGLDIAGMIADLRVRIDYKLTVQHLPKDS